LRLRARLRQLGSGKWIDQTFNAVCSHRLFDPSLIVKAPSWKDFWCDAGYGCGRTICRSRRAVTICLACNLRGNQFASTYAYAASFSLWVKSRHW